MGNIAICGLDCSSCDAFIATKNDDNELRKKTAEKWAKDYNHSGLKAENIHCAGCLSQIGPVFQYCEMCEVRKCGFEKKVKNCGECDSYPCDKITNLHKKTDMGKEVCDNIKNKQNN